MTAAESKFIAENGRQATVEELAQVNGLEEKAIMDLIRFRDYKVISLDHLPYGSYQSLVAYIPDEQAVNPLERMIREELPEWLSVDALRRAISSIPEEGRKLILEKFQGRSPEEIGKMLGLTTNVVKKRTLAHLRVIRNRFCQP